MNEKTAAAILICLCMVLPRSGSTAERKSDLRITYTPSSISVEAQNVGLLEVLRNISLKVGFDLANYGVPDRNLTISIQEATVEDVLRQLLGGKNYGVIYRERERTITKVLLLSSPVYAYEMQENQQARIEVSRAQEGLTIFPAAPSHQPPRPNSSKITETRIRQELRRSCNYMRSQAEEDRILLYRACRRMILNPREI